MSPTLTPTPLTRSGVGIVGWTPRCGFDALKDIRVGELYRREGVCGVNSI